MGSSTHVRDLKFIAPGGRVGRERRERERERKRELFSPLFHSTNVFNDWSWFKQKKKKNPFSAIIHYFSYHSWIEAQELALSFAGPQVH